MKGLAIVGVGLLVLSSASAAPAPGTAVSEAAITLSGVHQVQKRYEACRCVRVKRHTSQKQKYPNWDFKHNAITHCIEWRCPTPRTVTRAKRPIGELRDTRAKTFKPKGSSTLSINRNSAFTKQSRTPTFNRTPSFRRR